MYPGSDDIVARLRAEARATERQADVMNQAADELARLRRVIGRLQDDNKSLFHGLQFAVNRECDHCYDDIKKARRLCAKFELDLPLLP